MSKITTTFEKNGRVLLTTNCELSISHGRYIGTIGDKVQVFSSVRFRDKNDRRCGTDYSTAGFGGSYSVIQRNEAGEILLIVAVSTVEKLARVPGAVLAV